MSLDLGKLQAVVFDYGNTLIEYGPKQFHEQLRRLRLTLEDLYGPFELEKLKMIRDRQIVQVFHNDLRDNDFAEVAAELIAGLYNIEPDAAGVQAVMDSRYQAFVDAVYLPDGVAELLTRLKQRYHVALITNYPCVRSIQDSLTKIGLDKILEAVVISGEIGYVKPHPLPFEDVCRQLSVPAAACVYVGDNWLADVQGAKRNGFQAIHTSQYTPYEQFEPQPGDFQPDARIKHLAELKQMLA